MRSELELLQILREYLTEKTIKQAGGLCIIISYMRYDFVISLDEFKLLREIISKSRYTYKGDIEINSIFYWQPYALEPRMMYVDWLIEQRSDRESMKITIWKIVLTHVKRILGR